MPFSGIENTSITSMVDPAAPEFIPAASGSATIAGAGGGGPHPAGPASVGLPVPGQQLIAYQAMEDGGYAPGSLPHAGG